MDDLGNAIQEAMDDVTWLMGDNPDIKSNNRPVTNEKVDMVAKFVAMSESADLPDNIMDMTDTQLTYNMAHLIMEARDAVIKRDILAIMENEESAHQQSEGSAMNE